jgi:hypothetical protein
VPGLRPFDPYVGPKPFSREDSERFFGREEAADELLSLVLASRVVILYAQSGTGKSSVVNAGLCPLLEKKGFDVFPTARVQGGLPAGTTAPQLGNPYVYFTLASWGKQILEVAAEGAMSAVLGDLPRSTDHYGDPAYRLLIVDQFEELFTSFPACWDQRSRFATELVHCVANDERLRILLIVREDHLADVLSLVDAFPASLRSSMRLPLLSKNEAVQAIEGPLQGSGFCYAEGVAAKLADDLSQVRVEISPGKVADVPGDAVEPVQLQVVCSELWRALPPGTTVITSEHVSSHGDTTNALARYYDKAVGGSARQVRLDSVFIRRWISAKLITSAHTRGTAHRGVLLTAGMPNPAVEALENRHLIRAETRAGARWYELTHDRFLRPIEHANARAIRRSRFAYWGAAAAVLIIGLLLLDSSPRGRLDVFFRAELALIAAAGLVQASWLSYRRLLKYWQPFETMPMRTRMAALARKAPAFLIVVTAGLACLLFAAYYLLAKPYSCGGRGALRVLYQNTGFTNGCLQESSIAADWALAITSVLLAAVITFAGSQLSRRLAIRKWQRMADSRAGTDAAQEATHIPAHDETSSSPSVERIGKYEPTTGYSQGLGPALERTAPQMPQDGQTSRSRASAHGKRARARVLLMSVGIAAVVVCVAAQTVYFFNKSLPTPPGVTITARAHSSPVNGDVIVSYHGGKQAHATISGTISRSASGEVAKLTAQQFPFSSPPTVIASTKIIGGSQHLSFDVTPSLATRYQIEVFPSSSPTTPLSKSSVQTVYVTFAWSIKITKYDCPRPNCFVTIRLRVVTPPGTIKIESRKHVYFYFGLLLSSETTPPAPKALQLQRKNVKVSSPTILSSHEYQQIVTFFFKVGNNGYSWHYTVCVQDTEHKDGIGLSGYNGCGNATIPASYNYLG